MTTMTSVVQNTKPGKYGQLQEFDFSKFQYTPVGKFVIYRLRNEYDVKFLITGDVGDGKTALAVSLARWVRSVANDVFDAFHPWDVEEHAGLDVMKYLKAYKQSNPGDALVIDELQEAADKRRSMANEAVWLSWAWMKLRVRQVVSIGVLPTPSVLDGRLEELADVWIHVAKRGQAHPYYLHTKPFPPYTTYRIPFRMGDYRQTIGWPDLTGDEQYERLHEMKEESGVPGIDDQDYLTESDLEDAKREYRMETVERGLKLIQNGGIDTQSDLARVLDVNRSTVTTYKQKLEDDL